MSHAARKPENVNMQTDIQQTETPAALCSMRLLADGWREYPNQFRKYARCFYKRFDTPSVCSGNSDKPGMQIEIAVSDGYAGGVAMEMELCAGLKDGTWVEIQNYSLPKTVEEVTALIPRLLAMWESANDKAHPLRAESAQPKD
jgi:hypothetical protein